MFDDFMETPTFLFVRGDEASPDKSRPMTPAVPAVLGGAVTIRPVSLPITAACPDKRDFVVHEALQAAEKAVTQARFASEQAGKLAEQAEKALAVAREADRKAEAKVAASAVNPDSLKAATADAAGAVVALAMAQSAAQMAQEDAEVASSALDAGTGEELVSQGGSPRRGAGRSRREGMRFPGMVERGPRRSRRTAAGRISRSPIQSSIGIKRLEPCPPAS